MGWMARSRRQPRAAGYARRLQHPPSTLILGLVGFLFFAGIAVISAVLGAEDAARAAHVLREAVDRVAVSPRRAFPERRD